MGNGSNSYDYERCIDSNYDEGDGKSSDYYDDSDDNGGVVGADPAGGWVTICMNLCMYICMHICNYTYTIVYNVHAWTYVHVYRCVHDGGYMHGEG